MTRAGQHGELRVVRLARRAVAGVLRGAAPVAVGASGCGREIAASFELRGGSVGGVGGGIVGLVAQFPVFGVLVGSAELRVFHVLVGEIGDDVFGILVVVRCRMAPASLGNELGITPDRLLIGPSLGRRRFAITSRLGPLAARSRRLADRRTPEIVGRTSRSRRRNLAAGTCATAVGRTLLPRCELAIEAALARSPARPFAPLLE